LKGCDMSDPELLRREARQAFEAAQQVSLISDRQELLAMSQALYDRAQERELSQAAAAFNGPLDPVALFAQSPAPFAITWDRAHAAAGARVGPWAPAGPDQR
jgi:hypothetical protein